MEKGAGFLGTWEGYRNVFRVCRNVIWKAKVHLELNLAREVKGNNWGSLQYISSNRKIWENVGPLLMVTKDPEKAELMEGLFLLQSLLVRQPSGISDSVGKQKVWRKDFVLRRIKLAL